MSKRIVAFGASNSKNSINKTLAAYAASKLDDVTVNVLNLNDYEMPIFSIDREQESGIPELARQFKNQLRETDGIVISFAEHNGSFSTAFKNIFDWTSRIEKNIWFDKPMFLLATSPGGRGGKSVLETAVRGFPHAGGKVIASFSLPSFEHNFSKEEGITDSDLRKEFEEQLNLFRKAI